MIQRYSLVLAFACLCSLLTAQNPVWNWQTHCGSSASDKALDVALSSDGYVYTCGYFNDSAQFGPLFQDPPSNSKAAFLTRQDAMGNYMWAKYGDGYFDDRALGVCVDKDDNIIITGTYWSNVSFDAYGLQGSADHIFVVKYDPNGNIIWAITGGGDGDDHGYDVVTNSAGDIFLTGYLSTHYGPPTCTAVFGSLPQFSYSDSIAFVARISAAGQWMWVRTFDGTDVQRDNDITLDQQGNVYVAGGFYGVNKNFGPVTLSSNAGSRDIFVIKYDANGNFMFVEQVGGYNDDRADGITTGIDNKLYITGEFRAEVNFDGDTLNNNGGPGGRDIFVAKMDVNGNWLWASKAGSNDGSEVGRGITTTNQHCIFVTGQCNGSDVAFGDSISLNTGADGIQIFVAGIDTAGKWRWAMQAGGIAEDRGYGIDADNSCGLYFCGYYSAPSGTFGPFSDTTYGLKDAFTVRLDATCFDYTSDTLSSVNDPLSGTCAPFMDALVVPNSEAEDASSEIRNGDCMQDAQWIIYNLWAQPVYTSGDLHGKWDGTDQNGNKLPAGTYFYTITSSSLPVAATGRIQLVR